MTTLALKRGAYRVGSFLSVLGQLRETRLTASLEYLVKK
jgi:hypothetical protein